MDLDQVGQTMKDLKTQVAGMKTLVEGQSSTSTSLIPPFFYGTLGENFKDFIDIFNLAATVNRWDDSRKAELLPAYMKDNALEIYREQEPADKKKFDTIVTKLELRLQPVENQVFYQTVLHDRKQLDKESVLAYSKDLKRLLRGAYPTMTEDMKKTFLRDKFIAGLRPSLRRLVWRESPDKLETFAQAESLAVRYEAQNVLLSQDHASHAVSASEVPIRSERSPPARNDDVRQRNLPPDAVDQLTRQMDRLQKQLTVAERRLENNIGRVDRRVERMQDKSFDDTKRSDGYRDSRNHNYKGNSRYPQMSNTSREGFQYNNRRTSPQHFRRDEADYRDNEQRRTTDGRPRCDYCKRMGHVRAVCFKRLKEGNSQWAEAKVSGVANRPTPSTQFVPYRPPTPPGSRNVRKPYFANPNSGNQEPLMQRPSQSSDAAALAVTSGQASTQASLDSTPFPTRSKSSVSADLPVSSTSANIGSVSQQSECEIGNESIRRELETVKEQRDALLNQLYPRFVGSVDSYSVGTNHNVSLNRAEDRRRGRSGLSWLSSCCFILLTLLTVMTTSMATNDLVGPMLCQSHEGRNIWEIPGPVPCYSPIAEMADPIPAIVTLYKRNYMQYKTKAWKCQRVKSTVKTLEYFFGDESRRETSKNDLVVTHEQCSQMVRSKRIGQEPMINRGGLWMTENNVDWSYPGGGIHCCQWKVSSAVNAYMYKGLVYAKHGQDGQDSLMESTLGVVSHCKYETGSCALEDGAYLIWEVEPKQKCQFLKYKDIKGERAGKSFLSSDSTLALTFTREVWTKDCNGNPLRFADQGLPVRIEDMQKGRIRRSTKGIHAKLLGRNSDRFSKDSLRQVQENLLKGPLPDGQTSDAANVEETRRLTSEHGIVTTDLLAMTSQALDFTIKRSIRTAFQHSLAATCASMTSVVEITKANILANPTLAMRALTGRNDIYARAGGRSVEIFPCQELIGNTYKFLPMNETCTLEIPLSFEIGGSHHVGYLDPKTNIVHNHGSPTDCKLSEEIPVRLGNVTHLYNAGTGQAKKVTSMPILHALTWNQNISLVLLPTIFHQIVMYNWTDLQAGAVNLNELLSGMDFQRKVMHELGMRVNHKDPRQAAREVTRGIIGNGLSRLAGLVHIDWWFAWVLFVCSYVTICFFVLHCIPVLKGQALSVNIPNLTAKAVSWARQKYSETAAQPSPDLTPHLRRIPRVHQLTQEAMIECDNHNKEGIRHATILRGKKRRWSSMDQSESLKENVNPEPFSPRPTPVSTPNLPAPAFRVPLSEVIIEREEPCESDVRVWPEKASVLAVFGAEQSLKHSSCLTIQVEGIPMIGILDTGATVTLISKATHDYISSRVAPLNPSTIMRATSMSGHKLNMSGTIEVNIKIGPLVVTHTVFVVPDCPHDVVLGADYLKKLGRFSIDMTAGFITVRGKRVPLGRSNEVDYECLSVLHNPETVSLPARTQTIIPIPIPQFRACKGGILLEPTEHVFFSRGLFVGRVLIRQDQGHVPVRILNASRCSVNLDKGTILGNFYAVDDIETDASPDEELCPGTDVQQVLATSTMEPCVPYGLDLTNADLPPLQKTKLLDLLCKYNDVFVGEDGRLGRTNLIKFAIDTGDAAPIKQRAYRVPMSQRQLVRDHVAEMKRLDLIEESSSPWSSPIVLVAKKDGGVRFCVDYRKLNSVTKKDVWPLPRIDELLDASGLHCGGKQLTLSTIDCASGYMAVPCADDATKERTAFITPDSLMQYKVMPFGATCAPAVYSKCISLALAQADCQLSYRCCLGYLDDVVIFSPNFEQHLLDLEEVLMCMRKADLKLKAKKCQFARKEVTFLGHIITREGMKPDPAKIDKIKHYPRPHDVTGVRSFLGLASYYRRFIKGFAKIAGPLHNLLKKDTDFLWTDHCEDSFKLLCNALITEPILVYPDIKQPFTLYTDASKLAIGAVLTQEREGTERAVSYISRSCSKAEQNYGISEQEALAVVWSIKMFRHYLYGNRFTVVCDHQSLRWLMTTPSVSARLQRWALLLQEYDFEVKYRPGTANRNADCMSRIPYPEASEEDMNEEIEEEFQEHACAVDLADDLLISRQKADPEIVAMYNFLVSQKIPTDPALAKSVALNSPRYSVDNGVLYHLYPNVHRSRQMMWKQVVVPRSLREEVMAACHEELYGGAHLGADRTRSKLLPRYYWENMASDVKRWCDACKDCATRKRQGKRTKAPLCPIPVEGPFDRVAVDVLSGFPTTNSGNKYLIVFMDYLTKWPEVFATPDATSATIAKIYVDSICCRFGCARTLHSDLGKAFNSNLTKSICDLMDTRKTFTSPYHPSCDGLVEKFHSVLVHMLSQYVSANHKDYDVFLPQVLFSYRVSVQESTKESPAFLMFGRDLRLPIDCDLIPPQRRIIEADSYVNDLTYNLKHAWQLARANIAKAQEKQKFQYDKTASEPKFELNQRVYLHTPVVKTGHSRKLTHTYYGPYRIVELLFPNVIIEPCDKPNPKRRKRVHVNRLKPAKAPYVPRPSKFVDITENDSENDMNIQAPGETHVSSESEKEPSPVAVTPVVPEVELANKSVSPPATRTRSKRATGPKWPCAVCSKTVGYKGYSIRCTVCAKYVHEGKCSGLLAKELRRLSETEINKFVCSMCDKENQKTDSPNTSASELSE